MAVTGYGRLFKSLNGSAPKVDDSGPASIPEPKSSSSVKESSEGDESLLVKEEHYSQPLAFGFAPDITHLVNPDLKNMVSLPSQSPVLGNNTDQVFTCAGARRRSNDAT